MTTRHTAAKHGTTIRVSASINIFNAEELLAPALASLRPHVDHISVVYQTVSYWGNPAAKTLLPAIDSALARGLADDVAQYRPEKFPGDTPKRHEARKRTLGLDMALARKATHFLSLDTDEFYRPEEFCRAKQAIAAGGFDVTVCRIQDYHSRPIYQYRDLARYRDLDLYVPFICRVREGLAFDSTLDFFCAVDPSRRLPFARPHVFRPGELVMHHMTTVRCDRRSLISKFANAASRPVWQVEDPRELAGLVWNFDPRDHSAPPVTVVADEFQLGAIRQESGAESSADLQLTY